MEVGWFAWSPDPSANSFFLFILSVSVLRSVMSCLVSFSVLWVGSNLRTKPESLVSESEVEGVINTVGPSSGNWFRFCFVLVSCFRASWRGEAVWACERGGFVNAGHGCVLGACAAMYF